MSASQRRKGATYEREIVAILREALAIDVARNLSQVRDSGADILWKDWVFECKRRQRLSFTKWMAQAKAACVGVNRPVVVCREDQGENLVIMRFTDFLHLLRDKNDT
jgi:hypothetical protein